ncbi:LPXTG cell wall anchor domain-containing protein [Thermoflavimicrobium dichotomicum]|uniref:LPXTG-motif cell wall anchor domain-containing protein n=1 Tax=Thermoflavimicrobium dichotomicum TaxID=46223 RepID=A0A1I3JU66_9BACL|nr:LPXTG cell wall anchor domain-containing protein [Thermoflavimicrobium dichotomicum]SFI63807.1 LPXTG-motif cell wall anchor domain-containing protein [Thermoflavimicrobium dichotomicum]
MRRLIGFFSAFVLLLLILPVNTASAEGGGEIKINNQTVKYDNDKLSEVSINLSYGTGEVTGFWQIKINNSSELVYESKSPENNITATLNVSNVAQADKYTAQIQFKENKNNQAGEKVLASKEHVLPGITIDYKNESGKHAITGTFKNVSKVDGKWKVELKSSQQGSATNNTDTSNDLSTTLQDDTNSNNNSNTTTTDGTSQNTTDNSSQNTTNGTTDQNQSPSQTTQAPKEGEATDISFTAEFENVPSGSYDTHVSFSGKLDDIDTELSNTKTMQITGSSTSTNDNTGNGAKLPNTATSYPNGIVTGIVLLALGAILFQFRRA